MTLGNLTVSGWIYDIGTGNVRISENSDSPFTPLS
jgi:carbonic anhydrase